MRKRCVRSVTVPSGGSAAGTKAAGRRSGIGRRDERPALLDAPAASSAGRKRETSGRSITPLSRPSTRRPFSRLQCTFRVHRANRAAFSSASSAPRNRLRTALFALRPGGFSRPTKPLRPRRRLPTAITSRARSGGGAGFGGVARRMQIRYALAKESRGSRDIGNLLGHLRQGARRRRENTVALRRGQRLVERWIGSSRPFRTHHRARPHRSHRTHIIVVLPRTEPPWWIGSEQPIRISVGGRA